MGSSVKRDDHWDLFGRIRTQKNFFKIWFKAATISKSPKKCFLAVAISNFFIHLTFWLHKKRCRYRVVQFEWFRKKREKYFWSNFLWKWFWWKLNFVIVLSFWVKILQISKKCTFDTQNTQKTIDISKILKPTILKMQLCYRTETTNWI